LPTSAGRWRCAPCSPVNGSGNGPQYSGEAQPIVYDGVIYVVTGANDVFAIDVETGEILWTHEANLDPQITRSAAAGRAAASRSATARSSSGQLDGKLVALDQRTGEVVWSVQAERWQEGFRSRARRCTTTAS
jgi:quinohemoprotein ethanol dehydrogenase